MLNLQDFSGKHICVAISGGVDSVSLLHYLKGLEKDYGYALCAVHCEHGIRGEESLADARFVEEFCLQQGVPLYAFSEDCPARAKRDKQSLETAARAFRQDCFSRFRGIPNCGHCAERTPQAKENNLYGVCS